MKKSLLVFLFCTIARTLFAQWECPSLLGGNLRQWKESDFSWGIELTGGAGYIANSLILNQISLTGLNYTSDRHTVYFEGGIKTWYQGDFDLQIKSSDNTFGLRELFYGNQSAFGNLTLGLQSVRSKDVYLVNERVLGVNYQKDFKRFDLNVFGGTVGKSFARNGTFCNMAYLYDILPYINQPLIGEALGQTNLAGLTLGFHPSPTEDEFSEKTSFLRTETVGLALYSEFGNWIKSPVMIAGFYSDFRIGDGYGFKPEVLFAASGRPALIYCAKFDKSFAWGKHRTSVDAAVYAQTTFDTANGRDSDKGNEGKEGEVEKTNEVKAVNSFGNILAGTVLRFDTPDMPFFTVSVKHTIPAAKVHLKLQFVSRVKASPDYETDVEIGMKFFGKLLVNATYGHIYSPALVKKPNLFRMEMRFNF